MICSYLVFSGLCKNCEQAFRHYARIRTKNNKGVTIASQRRYIKYFENFLKANFYPPYMKLIPKIIRTQFSFLINGNYVRIKNILQSFQKEESYICCGYSSYCSFGRRIGSGCLNRWRHNYIIFGQR